MEILDESGTELLEEVENDEDNGPIAEWGLWYRNPSEKCIDEARKVVGSNVVGLDDVELMESPGRKKRRDEAFKALEKQASQMKKRAKLKDGEVNVGCVVQIAISNYDRTKLDAPNLTCVVVEVTKSGKFRLACKVRVMNTLYSMNRISVVKTGTKELLGLEDAFKEWKGMSKISEREAARKTSKVD